MARFYDFSTYYCLLKVCTDSELLNGHSVSIHGSSLQKYRHRAVFNKLYKSCLLLAQMLNLHIIWKLLYTWNNCLVYIFIILSPAMSWGLGNLTTSKCSLPLISCVHALWCQLWWFSHGVGWQCLSSILIGGLHVMIKEHKCIAQLKPEGRYIFYLFRIRRGA